MPGGVTPVADSPQYVYVTKHRAGSSATVVFHKNEHCKVIGADYAVLRVCIRCQRMTDQQKKHY